MFCVHHFFSAFRYLTFQQKNIAKLIAFFRVRLYFDVVRALKYLNLHKQHLIDFVLTESLVPFHFPMVAMTKKNPSIHYPHEYTELSSSTVGHNSKLLDKDKQIV